MNKNTFLKARKVLGLIPKMELKNQTEKQNVTKQIKNNKTKC